MGVLAYLAPSNAKAGNPTTDWEKEGSKAMGGNPAIRKLKARFHVIVEDFPKVLLAYLFGSQVEGRVGPLSDFDFAVLFDSMAMRMEVRARLSSVLARELGAEHVDIVSLNDAPPELAYAAISCGELLYEYDVETRVEYEAGVMGRYSDYLPLLRAARGDILRGEDHAPRVQRYRKAFGRTERTLGQIRAIER